MRAFQTWLNELAENLNPNQTGTEPAGPATALERVTALLLIEVARADHVIEAAERQRILAALAASTDLTRAEIEGLFEELAAEADTTVSLHEHVSAINQAFDREQKMALLEQMWRVAVADGEIDRYEDYTIRKVSELMFLKHRDFMQAKLRVVKT